MRALKDVLPGTLRRVGRKRGREIELRARWSEMAGPVLASRSTPHLVGDVVRIEVEDPSWVDQIDALRATLVPRLNSAVGPVVAIEVVVAKRPRARRAKPWSAPRAADAGSGEPAGTPEGVLLASEEIADPDLKDQLRRVAAGYLAHRQRRDRRDNA